MATQSKTKKKPAQKVVKASVQDGVVPFIFEALTAELPSLEPSAEAQKVIDEAAAYEAGKFESWGLKDKHVPAVIKDNMYGESVTGYLYDRKEFEAYMSKMNHDQQPDTGHSDDAAVAAAETGGSGGGAESGPQDGDKVGG